MLTASNVAKYLIHHFCFIGQPISNLKLQKLLYYCQGFHLAINRKPLFRERIEAWVHGPVVPVVFREYRDFRWSPVIEDPGMPTFPSKVTEVLDSVVEGYGKLSAAQLEALSHKEDPWLKARGGLPPNVPCACEISHESMIEYFSRLID